MRALSPHDDDWPRALFDLPDPPDRLYVRGTIPDPRRAVAIVGSRAASDYGRARARELAADLVRLGYAVVSGLARGIDAAAHRGALEAGGRSLAVLPSGLDCITPPQHAALAEALARDGALVSEWPEGPPRGPGVFVTRNRIVAALSVATVVVEAAVHSGALTTAAFARAMGRPVLAVPGDVDRPTARGAHGLLRCGAAVCECAADVLAALGAGGVPGHGAGAARTHATPQAPELPLAHAGDTPAQRLLAALDATPRPLDVLATAAALDAADALPALLELTWSGVAHAWPGQRWSLPPR